VLDALQILAKDNKIETIPQDDSQSTYAPLLTKEDGHINWSQTAAQIDRQISALNPWPGTYIENFKIKSAKLTEQTTDQPAGTILDKSGNIACGQGSVLTLKSIQPAGKKPMDFQSALNGGYVTIGEVIA